MAFKIDVAYTGSKGNCVIIDDKIIIDIGRSFKDLQDYVLQADVILVTHRHIDHINLAVINQLNKKAPWKINSALYMNEDVIEKVRTHKSLGNFSIPDEHILTSDMAFEITANDRVYKVQTFLLDHDVPNQGFVITNDEGDTLIYATDTSTLKYAPRGKYDYLLLEGNYDEDKLADDMDVEKSFEFFVTEGLNNNVFSREYTVHDLVERVDVADEDEELLDKMFKLAVGLFDRAIRNMRHLSVQEFEQFVIKNSKPSSIIYQLHESEGFGLRSDLTTQL